MVTSIIRHCCFLLYLILKSGLLATTPLSGVPLWIDFNVIMFSYVPMELSGDGVVSFRIYFILARNDMEHSFNERSEESAVLVCADFHNFLLSCHSFLWIDLVMLSLMLLFPLFKISWMSPVIVIVIVALVSSFAICPCIRLLFHLDSFLFQLLL